MEGKKKGEGGEGKETEKESSEKKHCPRFRAFPPLGTRCIRFYTR